MAKATIWKNVNVQMQSAIAADIKIDSITKASNGVVTTDSVHGLTTGDFVMLKDIQGMWQVNERVFKVTSLTGSTFSLGVETTEFDDFISGNMAEITYGHTITTATNISSSGGDFDFVDTTTIHENTRSQIPGLPSAITFSMENLWDPNNSGQVAMKQASDAQSMRAIKFQFGVGGAILVFTGYVGFAGLPGGSAQDKVTTQAVFTMNGTPSYYSGV